MTLLPFLRLVRMLFHRSPSYWRTQVSLRFQIYGWFMDRPGVVLRWLMVNFLIIMVFSVLVALLDVRVWGNLEQRWGLTVWFSFVVGFTAVAVFNIIMGLLGLGYREAQERGEAPPST